MLTSSSPSAIQTRAQERLDSDENEYQAALANYEITKEKAIEDYKLAQILIKDWEAEVKNQELQFKKQLIQYNKDCLDIDILREHSPSHRCRKEILAYLQKERTHLESLIRTKEIYDSVSIESWILRNKIYPNIRDFNYQIRGGDRCANRKALRIFISSYFRDYICSKYKDLRSIPIIDDDDDSTEIMKVLNIEFEKEITDMTLSGITSYIVRYFIPLICHPPLTNDTIREEIDSIAIKAIDKMMYQNLSRTATSPNNEPRAILDGMISAFQHPRSRLRFPPRRSEYPPQPKLILPPKPQIGPAPQEECFLPPKPCLQGVAQLPSFQELPNISSQLTIHFIQLAINGEFSKTTEAISTDILTEEQCGQIQVVATDYRAENVLQKILKAYERYQIRRTYLQEENVEEAILNFYQRIQCIQTALIKSNILYKSGNTEERKVYGKLLPYVVDEIITQIIVIAQELEACFAIADINTQVNQAILYEFETGTIYAEVDRAFVEIGIEIDPKEETARELRELDNFDRKLLSNGS